MTRNRFVSLLEVSLQSLGPLQCPEGVLGGGYICPKYVDRECVVLYQRVDHGGRGINKAQKVVRAVMGG